MQVYKNITDISIEFVIRTSEIANTELSFIVCNNAGTQLLKISISLTLKLIYAGLLTKITHK